MWFNKYSFMYFTERLKKVFRWNDEKIARMRRVMLRIKARVDKEFTEGDKQVALQKLLDEYMKGLWGRHLVVLKAYTRKRRQARLKKRAITKQARKLKKWQDVEDMKEVCVVFHSLEADAPPALTFSCSIL
jgi:hypothetical protein